MSIEIKQALENMIGLRADLEEMAMGMNSLCLICDDDEESDGFRDKLTELMEQREMVSSMIKETQAVQKRNVKQA